MLVWPSAPGNQTLSGGLEYQTGSLGLGVGLKVISWRGLSCVLYQKAILFSQSSGLLIGKTCKENECILFFSIHWFWNAHSFMYSFVQYSLNAHYCRCWEYSKQGKENWLILPATPWPRFEEFGGCASSDITSDDVMGWIMDRQFGPLARLWAF